MSNLEQNCKWHFAKQLGGREDGPNDPMSDNFKKYPYASLIRESIQNSLDVPLDSSLPVRMEFSIGRIRAKEYPNFFDIKKHIQGCITHFPNNQDAKSTYSPMLSYLDSLSSYDSLYYIKVSDYNTIGMDYTKGDTSCPFYAFVRAAGVSAKSDTTAGGSFGYGKAAYFYISPLRTIFVSTKTEHNRFFFEGVSSLCTHNLEGDDHLRVSVGYYDNNDGEPITEFQNIPSRFQRDVPGTDIFIIGIDASDRQGIYNEMVEAVLRNFWLSIENSKLEVKIGDIEINKESLPSMMEQYFPGEHDTVRRERQMNPRPYWEAVHLAGSDKYHLLFDDKLPTIGRVRFYAFKSKKAIDKVLYMRRPLMLVKARRTQSSNGFYGVFVCEDRYGNAILRETENPAHDEWVASNWRENGKIVTKGREAIAEIDDYIIQVMERMFSNRESNTQQIQGLEEFLYIPTAVDDDNEFDSESLVGDVVNQIEDESNSISTDMINPSQSSAPENPAIGKVMVSDPLSQNQKRNKEGGHLSGHGTKHKTNRGGGGLSNKRIEGHFDPSEDGIQGTILKEVPVRYRSFAQVSNNQVVHNIVIHSDYDIPNGRIDLKIGGEQSDDIVAIRSCSPEGIINANSISALHIKEGRNILKIVFADNMKHAVKLDAYELK